MPLSIEDVVDTLKNMKVPAETIIKIENELEAKEAEVKADRLAGAPKQKSELVTVLLDPEHRLDGLGDFTSLVIQIPQGQDAGTTLSRLYQSVYDQRAGMKRKVFPIESVSDAAGVVKRKWFKQNSLHIRTKEPVRVLVSDDTIPAV